MKMIIFWLQMTFHFETLVNLYEEKVLKKIKMILWNGQNAMFQLTFILFLIISWWKILRFQHFYLDSGEEKFWTLKLSQDWKTISCSSVLRTRPLTVTSKVSHAMSPKSTLIWKLLYLGFSKDLSEICWRSFLCFGSFIYKCEMTIHLRCHSRGVWLH